MADTEDDSLDDVEWLKETYDRSPDKCEKVTPEQIRALSEITAAMGKLYGDDGGKSADDLYNSYLDPFLSNVREADKDIFLQAAKLSGVNVRFGPPTSGTKGHVALYSDNKGTYDLSRFWARAKELKDARDA